MKSNGTFTELFRRKRSSFWSIRSMEITITSLVFQIRTRKRVPSCCVRDKNRTKVILLPNCLLKCFKLHCFHYYETEKNQNFFFLRTTNELRDNLPWLETWVEERELIREVADKIYRRRRRRGEQSHRVERNREERTRERKQRTNGLNGKREHLYGWRVARRGGPSTPYGRGESILFFFFY